MFTIIVILNSQGRILKPGGSSLGLVYSFTILFLKQMEYKAPETFSYLDVIVKEDHFFCNRLGGKKTLSKYKCIISLSLGHLFQVSEF